MKESPSSITVKTIVVATSEQLTCDLAGEAAILHVPEGIYYGLNETGSFIWERIQEPKTVAELHAAILSEFQVTPEEAERDLFVLLSDLIQAKLVETRDAMAS